MPLSAIAREAGVGQGVLYRHFPTRLDLALAVFEETFAELEGIAAEPGPDAFARLWERLVVHTVEEAAFLEMVVTARRELAGYDGEHRLLALIEPPLARARAAGRVAPSLTARDVVLAQRMAYGVVATALEPAGVRDAVRRAMGLLGHHGLAPDAAPSTPGPEE